MREEKNKVSFRIVAIWIKIYLCETWIWKWLFQINLDFRKYHSPVLWPLKDSQGILSLFVDSNSRHWLGIEKQTHYLNASVFLHESCL